MKIPNAEPRFMNGKLGWEIRIDNVGLGGNEVLPIRGSCKLTAFGKKDFQILNRVLKYLLLHKL